MGLEVVPGKGAPFDPNVRSLTPASSHKHVPARDAHHSMLQQGLAHVLPCVSMQHTPRHG